MAALCVLFEDLRIELSGQVEDNLLRMDECGKEGRRFYFLRRSIATLYEFSEVIQELDTILMLLSLEKTQCWREFRLELNGTWCTAFSGLATRSPLCFRKVLQLEGC